MRAAVVQKPLRKAEEANFKANFSFFTSLSTAEAHVFGVKFIGLYETFGFTAIRDVSFLGESDLRSDVWSAMPDVSPQCQGNLSIRDGGVSLLAEVSHDEAKIKDLL